MPDGLHGMAVTSDGETSYTFGGRTGSYTSIVYKTLFQITPSQGLYQKLEPTGPSHTAPEGASFCCMVQFKDKLVLHGARNTSQRRPNELHVFDLTKRMWTLQPTRGEEPPLLRSHTFTKIDCHRAVVFAGYDWRVYVNDTYVLDIEKWVWTKMKITGDKPPARRGHATCCIAGPLTGQQYPLLVVVGGERDFGVEGFGDVWLLDVDKRVWNEVALPVTITPRYCHSAVVFGSGPSFRILVLFGGCKPEWIRRSDVMSETTLLLLELREGTWQVTRVVKPDELRNPDERLKEQMRKLELFSQKEHPTQSTATDSAASPTTQKEISSSTHTTEGGTSRKNSPSTDTAVATTAHKGTIHTSTIDPADLKYSDKQLGGGAQGIVWKGTWKGKEVAIKKCLQLDPKDVYILQQLGTHPNIITLYGVVVDMESRSCSIVTELVKGGSLYNFLHKEKKTPSDEQKFSWMEGIARGMLFLHGKGLAHRDLKSGNVLLADDDLFTAKLCDFGTARELDHTMAQTAMTGTYRWMAPEVIKDDNAQINQKCDVFSYSMVLCEIVTQELPFSYVKSDKLAMFELFKQQRPALPSSDAECPPYLRHLITACWAEEPQERPAFMEICQALENKYFP